MRTDVANWLSEKKRNKIRVYNYSNAKKKLEPFVWCCLLMITLIHGWMVHDFRLDTPKKVITVVTRYQASNQLYDGKMDIKTEMNKFLNK